MKVSGAARLVSSSAGKAQLEVAGRLMFELNEVGAIIWQQLASNVPADMIVGHLVALFGASHEQANRDVTNFIEVLKKHWLVYDDKQFTTSPPSISP
jgi:Coenzyme PQQ synthesis protein D (PqqD)